MDVLSPEQLKLIQLELTKARESAKAVKKAYISKNTYVKEKVWWKRFLNFLTF